jgi:hypothetical protein
MKQTARHHHKADLLHQKEQPADGTVCLKTSLQNPASAGFLTSNRQFARIHPARAAMNFVVNEVSRLAATRRSLFSCAVIPRTSFVAHSHILKPTASACRVLSSSTAHAYAARLGNLNIQSLQDSSTFTSKDRTSGGCSVHIS